MLKALQAIRREGGPSLHTEGFVDGDVLPPARMEEERGRLLAPWVASGPWGHMRRGCFAGLD